MSWATRSPALTAISYSLYTLLTLKLGFVVVEEDDLDFTTVVGVHDARANIDAVLGSEAGTRRDAAVRAGRDGDGDLGRDEVAPAGREDDVGSGVQIVAGREGRSARGSGGLGREELDEELVRRLLVSFFIRR